MGIKFSEEHAASIFAVEVSAVWLRTLRSHAVTLAPSRSVYWNGL